MRGMFLVPILFTARPKLAGETNALEYCKKTMIIRTAWLYSTFGNNFVKTMLRLGKEKETLGVVFDQIGTPTYARDLGTCSSLQPFIREWFREFIISVMKEYAPGMILPRLSIVLPVSRPVRFSLLCIIPNRKYSDRAAASRPNIKSALLKGNDPLTKFNFDYSGIFYYAFNSLIHASRLSSQ